MSFLAQQAPTSFSPLAATGADATLGDIAAIMDTPGTPFVRATASHGSHPSFGHLVLLVFEAVMEVVCVALPGYVIARLGHFDAEKQKFLANLNVMLFTPCLIFTKLASKLNAAKLAELGVIPVIFVIQTLVSYAVSRGVSRCLGFNSRASNFVTAMGVFGNSNSLPISLVISLSQTLKGLHWDKVPGDNDDEVAARGILYLMIFQQLGQLVRWSWGYHVLLAPKHKYQEYQDELVEEGRPLMGGQGSDTDSEGADRHITHSDDVIDGVGRHHHRTGSNSDESVVYEPAGQTPTLGTSAASPEDSEDEGAEGDYPKKRRDGKDRSPKTVGYSTYRAQDLEGALDDIQSFPPIRNREEQEMPGGIKGLAAHARLSARKLWAAGSDGAATRGRRIHASLPGPVRSSLSASYRVSRRACASAWEFMNPPLWAMLIALLVASVPRLQRLFFQEGTFINNSVTSAVSQSAGVAVPLILVVLGANLARNTQAHEDSDPEEKEIGTKLLVASLVSRMLLPTLIMAPILALFAKYVPVSILDDPIFIIVCFLLAGAPSALQLAQICQINNVFENRMSQILFQSYVVWILPSTLVLVMCALEVVEWAR